MATFGFVLELLRQSRGMTVETLGAKTQIPVSDLKALAENKMPAPPETISRLADALNCTPADFTHLMQQDVYPDEAHCTTELAIGTSKDHIGSEQIEALHRYRVALKQLACVMPNFLDTETHRACASDTSWTATGFLKRCILRLTADERRKKAHMRFEEERQRLNAMPLPELKSEYVTVRSAYETRKRVTVPFLVVTLLTALLIGSWCFLGGITQASRIAVSNQPDAAETAQLAFIIIATVTGTAVVTAALLVIACIRRHRELCQQLLLIEDVLHTKN